MLSGPGRSVRFGSPLVLTTDWAKLSVTLPANIVDAGVRVWLQVTGAHPGQRAAVAWLDDVTVTVNSTAALQ